MYESNASGVCIWDYLCYVVNNCMLPSVDGCQGKLVHIFIYKTFTINHGIG